MTITSLQRLHHKSTTRPARIGVWLGTAFMGVAAAYFLLPLVWIAIANTKTGSQLYNSPMFLPSSLSQFMNNLSFTLTVNHGIYRVWYVNSLLYSSTAAILSSLVSFLCGFALSKYSFRFRRLFSLLVIIALMLPTAALVVPTFLVLRDMGLINTRAGVILPMIMSPLGTYFMRVYLGGAIPDLLLDSARVDGASEWRIIWRIALPIAFPGMVTVFLLAFVVTWNSYFLPLIILNDSRLFPVVLGLQNFPDPLMGSFLSVLPVIGLFVFLNRFISSGLLSGGLKM